MHRTRLLLVLAGGFVVGCSSEKPRPSVDESAEVAPAVFDGPRKIKTQHLPNAVHVHAKVISGGLPQGDAAFRELKTLGVKTIISVDGAKPDVATAAGYGLRYVHLPHGYDGIPEERVRELAKAVRDLEGPIYLHCHHGRHRSPAAASVACVAAGLLPPSAALPVLELSGTSRNYRGLYQSANEARPLEAVLLDELNVEFRDTVDVPPLAEAMVAIERTHDHLKQFAAAGWRTPAKHPDLEPAHEALLLREHFTELLRVDYVEHQPEEFRQLLRDSEGAAGELEGELREWKRTGVETAHPQSLGRLSGRITANCKTCHWKYRDVPLGEKPGKS